VRFFFEKKSNPPPCNPPAGGRPGGDISIPLWMAAQAAAYVFAQLHIHTRLPDTHVSMCVLHMTSAEPLDVPAGEKSPEEILAATHDLVAASGGLVEYNLHIQAPEPDEAMNAAVIQLLAKIAVAPLFQQHPECAVYCSEVRSLSIRTLDKKPYISHVSQQFDVVIGRLYCGDFCVHVNWIWIRRSSCCMIRYAVNFFFNF
jgi:hypothetical protein